MELMDLATAEERAHSAFVNSFLVAVEKDEERLSLGMLIAENCLVKLIADYVGIPRGRRLRHIRNAMRTWRGFNNDQEIKERNGG